VGAKSKYQQGKEAKKATRETTVKCAIGQRVKRGMRAAVEGLVEDLSKAAHKASLVFNAMLLYCLTLGLELPPMSPDEDTQATFIHCFKVGDEAGPTVITPQVLAAWNAVFVPLAWPRLPRVQGDCNAIVYAATTYQTNFANSCKFVFEGRQKAHVRSWCATAGAPHKTDVTPILAAINGWTCARPMPVLAGLTAFIAAERAALGLVGLAAGEKPDVTWRGKNLDKVVRYYYHILGAQAAHTVVARARQAAARADAELTGKDEVRVFFPRGFSLAPICAIKRHSVTIDKLVLAGLNRAAIGLKPYARPPPGVVIPVGWSLFNFEGLRPSSRPDGPSAQPELGGAHLRAMDRGASVKTDGVALSVLYRVQLTAAEQARKAATDTSTKRAKLAKAEKAAGKAVVEAEGPLRAPPLLAGQRLVAFDPGRRTLMYGVERLANGALKKHVLSRGAYYCGMGTKRAKARRDGWIARAEGVPAAHAELTTVTAKTGDAAAFGAYLTVVRAHYELLWAFKLPRKWAHEALRAFILKHRVMDRFFKSIKTATEGTVDPLGLHPIRIAYGDAKFDATGNGGELSAPVTFQLKRAKQAFGPVNVCMEDEYCTTKCCAACGARGVTSVLQTILIRRGPRVDTTGMEARQAAEAAEAAAMDATAAAAAGGSGGGAAPLPSQPSPPRDPREAVAARQHQQQQAAAAAPAAAGGGGGDGGGAAPLPPPPRRLRRRVEVRGLKRCSNTVCSKFYDRDANAARNILAVHLARAAGAPRPKHLSRDSAANRREPGSFVIVACGRPRTKSKGGPEGGPEAHAVVILKS
jgi:hypothetical protein